MRLGKWVPGLLIVAGIVSSALAGCSSNGAPSAGAAGRSSAAVSSSTSPSSTPSPTATQTPLPGVIQPTGSPVFTARFNGSTLNTSLWSTCYPYAGLSGCTNFANGEYEWYLPAQDQVYGGVLHLVAQKMPTAGTAKDGSAKTYACRSGMVTSYPGLQFKYGYLQVVARIPAEPGMWPALWLDPADGQWPPEIDMLERWGVSLETGEFFHPIDQGTMPKSERRLVLSPSVVGTGWHTFALSWSRTQLTWLIDGKQYFVERMRVPHLPMYFIANLAAYLNPTSPGECSGSLDIRSIKLWKA